MVTPAVQWPLKSETNRTPVPIPGELALMLSAAVAAADSTAVVTNELGRPAGPWAIERAYRAARDTVPGLPAAASTTCGTTAHRCSSPTAST